MATNWQQATRQTALRFGLDPDLFSRQIGAESNFNPNARSPAGATGIAQIMPATARGWGVDPNDPQAALNAAAKAMSKYVRNYGGWRNALVAYNAGPGRVGKPLYGETEAYINKILGGRNNVTWEQQNLGGGWRGNGFQQPAQTTAAVDPKQLAAVKSEFDNAIKLRQGQVKDASDRLGKFDAITDEQKQLLNYRYGAREAQNLDMRERAGMAQGMTAAQQNVADMKVEAKGVLADYQATLMQLQRDKTSTVNKLKAKRITVEAQGLANQVGWNGEGSPFKYLEKMFGLRRSSSDNDAPGVHTGGSFHYRPAAWGGVQGYDYGDALNDPKKLKALGAFIRQNYKQLGINEAFYNPWGFGIDSGKLIDGYRVDNHDDHVHLAIDRILGGRK